MARQPRTIVFDIGNVLIRWNPRNMYRKMFADHDRMEWFLANVTTDEWNLEQDRGRSFAEAVRVLSARHPDWAKEIRAYDERWHDMLDGAIAENVAVLETVRKAGIPDYAVTNFNDQKLEDATRLHPFLGGFKGIIVSAKEKVVKPDAAIFRRLLDRYGLEAADCVFIDDSPKNVAGAQGVGMHAILFREGETEPVAPALRRLGFPV